LFNHIFCDQHSAALGGNLTALSKDEKYFAKITEKDLGPLAYSKKFRGLSSGGVEEHLFVFFCLIPPKIIKKIVFLSEVDSLPLFDCLSSFATFVQGVTRKKVVLGSDITGDMNR